MFKQILVPTTGTAADAAAIATALAAGRLFGAHLEFLHARPDPAAAVMSAAIGDGSGGFAAAGLFEAVEQLGAEAEARTRAAFADLQTAEGLAPDAAKLVVRLGDEARWLVEHGRTADLLVTGRRRDAETVALGLLQDVLLASGRPVLLAPETAPGSLLDLVVIAWKDTAEAARAVAAATPFIARATEVLVLTVDEGAPAPDAPGADSCERLVATLRRHNPYVNARHLVANGGKPVDILLAAAEEARASLLVMGGYGHSRTREMVFGGFTQHVLRGAAMPVLMAH